MSGIFSEIIGKKITAYRITKDKDGGATKFELKLDNDLILTTNLYLSAVYGEVEAAYLEISTTGPDTEGWVH